MSASKIPIQSFHHIEFWVSNAQQASFWHCFHFDFHRFARRRTKSTSQIAIRKGPIVFVFKCSISPDDSDGIGAEVGKRGDFVKDVSYQVDDLDAVIATLLENGIELLEPKHLICDQNGSLAIAKIAGSAGSIVHTLIQNSDFRGLFMPGFHPIKDFSISAKAASIPLLCLDHVVEAHPEQSIGDAVDWYQRSLQMRRFWSIDDKTVHTEFSALRALLVGNGGAKGSVKMVLVEPVTVAGGTNNRKGQIEEFLHFHGSSGIQHIAFRTENIVESVRSLRERGVEFLDIPDTYYEMLEQRLAGSKFIDEIGKDLDEIRKMKILMDFDEHGYLLQIFTKPIQDRMTFFLEIIQRQNFDGFGAGNFRALFAAVEMEQKRSEEESISKTADQKSDAQQ